MIHFTVPESFDFADVAAAMPDGDVTAFEGRDVVGMHIVRSGARIGAVVFGVTEDFAGRDLVICALVGRGVGLVNAVDDFARLAAKRGGLDGVRCKTQRAGMRWHLARRGWAVDGLAARVGV